MTKISKKKIAVTEFGLYVNNLWSAFTLMDTKEDIKLLFKDLFTHTEYKMFTKRLEIARRLMRGQTYEEIEKALGVTNRTITHVNNILAVTGAGLKKAHDKLSQMENKIFKKEKARIKNLENPLINKLKRKTLLGTVFKAGIKSIDAKITKHNKQKSAQKILTV